MRIRISQYMRIEDCLADTVVQTFNEGAVLHSTGDVTNCIMEGLCLVIGKNSYVGNNVFKNCLIMAEEDLRGNHYSIALDMLNGKYGDQPVVSKNVDLERFVNNKIK